VHLADEVAQHGLGHLEVRDDAVPHGADGHDVARGLAEHGAGFLAHGQNPVLGPQIGADRHHGGLVEDDALALYVDQRVRRPEIDRQIVGENPQNAVK